MTRTPFAVSSEDPESFDRAIITIEHADDGPVTFIFDGETYITTKADIIAALRRVKAGVDQ